GAVPPSARRVGRDRQRLLRDVAAGAARVARRLERARQLRRGHRAGGPRPPRRRPDRLRAGDGGHLPAARHAWGPRAPVRALRPPARLDGARRALALYLSALALESVRVGRDAPLADALALPAVYATMHLSWGAGFLAGCLEGLSDHGRPERP